VFRGLDSEAAARRVAGATSSAKLYLRQAATMNLNAHFLFASLIWGSIGLGYSVYGKKQSSLVPFIGGLLMMCASYFIGSALLMSIACLGIMGAVYLLLKLGL
jgi:glucose dehydrogenase